MLQLFIVFSIFSIVFSICPENSIPWQSECYGFKSTPQPFIIAETECNELGGYLASVHNGFTNTFIAQKSKTEIKDTNVADIWLGINNLENKGNWTWTDGSPYDFQNWRSFKNLKVPQICGAITLSDGNWDQDNCFKSKPFVCIIASVTSTTTALTNRITTTPSQPSPIPFTLNPKCLSAPLKTYVNYFIDAGSAPPERFQLYIDIITATSQQQSIGAPTQNIALYMANGDGGHSDLIQLNDQNNLTSALINTIIAPSQLDETVKLTNDLNYYQNVLPTQLNYTATPVIVMFLSNPIEDLETSKAKMEKIKNASPKTYFMCVLLSMEPTISQLPCEYTINLTAATSTAAQDTVNTIFDFICTVSLFY